MQISTYYTVSIIIFMLFFMDEIFQTDIKSGIRFNNTVDLSKLGELVWSGPPSSALSRRSVFNPSIIYHSGCWHVFTRYTRGRRLLQCMLQYSFENDVVTIRGEKYRASILYYRLDGQFNPISEEPVYVREEPLPGFSPTDPLFWQGEDPRVFRNEKNQLRLQATVHKGDIRKLAQGCVSRMDDYLIWEVERVVDSPVSEKNWAAIPLTNEGSQLFLKHVSPNWTVGTLNTKGKFTPIIESNKYEKKLTKLRCTSCCCTFRQNTLLTCLHTTHPYQTVLCEIDSKTLLPTRLSLPLRFRMEDSYIEFPSGLCIRDNYVYFGLGLNDTTCEIRKFSMDEVEKLLVKVL